MKQFFIKINFPIYSARNSSKKTFSKGLILLNVLLFGVIAIIVTTALINWATTMLRSSKQLGHREQAFQIAEAGIDYYRWHLAHAQNDYTDGIATTTNGPFLHDFKDKDGNIVGQFSLTITPPSTGSTIVIIKSKGAVVEDPLVSRTIQTTLGIPSLAKYSVVANDVMRFGDGTEVFGPIHSNNGVRFDGLAHNIVTSAVAEYNDPDHGGQFGPMEFGVHTHITPVDPEPPSSVPLRPDVFGAGRTFPVPAVDFDGFTYDLANLKTVAQNDGLYFADSGALGYNIVLK